METRYPIQACPYPLPTRSARSRSRQGRRSLPATQAVPRSSWTARSGTARIVVATLLGGAALGIAAGAAALALAGTAVSSWPAAAAFTILVATRRAACAALPIAGCARAAGAASVCLTRAPFLLVAVPLVAFRAHPTRPFSWIPLGLHCALTMQKGPPDQAVLFVWLSPAVSYSPTPSRVQYHRRWRA